MIKLFIKVWSWPDHLELGGPWLGIWSILQSDYFTAWIYRNGVEDISKAAAGITPCSGSCPEKLHLGITHHKLSYLNNLTKKMRWLTATCSFMLCEHWPDWLFLILGNNSKQDRSCFQLHEETPPTHSAEATNSQNYKSAGMPIHWKKPGGKRMQKEKDRNNKKSKRDLRKEKPNTITRTPTELCKGSLGIKEGTVAVKMARACASIAWKGTGSDWARRAREKFHRQPARKENPKVDAMHATKPCMESPIHHGQHPTHLLISFGKIWHALSSQHGFEKCEWWYKPMCLFINIRDTI